MLGSGKTIKCMESVSCITRMGRLHTKEIGIMTSFVVLARCLTTDPKSLLASLITMISLTLARNGSTMKANLKMTRSTGRAKSD